MRGKKRIVLVATIFLLSSAAIFSNTKQDKRKILTNSSHRDLLKNKDKFRLRFGLRQLSSEFAKLPGFVPTRDYQPQYVPDEIIVRFKMPISDFELAHLFGEFQSNIIGARRVSDDSFVVRFPENYSIKHMVQVFERNPYVEYAEPNNLVRHPDRPDDFGNYSFERPHGVRSARRNPEALKREDMIYRDTFGETNLVRVVTNAGREAVKKDNGIPPYPKTCDNIKKMQISDPKCVIRSKVKIYTYKDSEGRLVITNYYHCKSNAKKQ